MISFVVPFEGLFELVVDQFGTSRHLDPSQWFVQRVAQQMDDPPANKPRGSTERDFFLHIFSETGGIGILLIIYKKDITGKKSIIQLRNKERNKV